MAEGNGASSGKVVEQQVQLGPVDLIALMLLRARAGHVDGTVRIPPEEVRAMLQAGPFEVKIDNDATGAILLAIAKRSESKIVIPGFVPPPNLKV